MILAFKWFRTPSEPTCCYCTLHIGDIEFWRIHNSANYFLQGSAKRLLNGNTLLANTGKQFVIEVTPEGKTVARFKGTAPVYKAFKYTKEQIGDLIDSSKHQRDKEKDD